MGFWGVSGMIASVGRDAWLVGSGSGSEEGMVAVGGGVGAFDDFVGHA